MTLSHAQVARAIDAVLPLAHDAVTTASPEARARARRSPVLSVAADGYRQVADQASVALFLTDADGLIIDANPATAALLGRGVDEVVGLTVADITHPDDVETSRARLAGALLQRVPTYRISKRYLRGDGTGVTADVTVSLLRDEHGSPIGFFAAAVDDTERVEAEAHARRADALLRATVDAFLDPWVYLVAVRDDAGEIVDFEYADANQAACDHNDMTREQLLGRRLLDLLPSHAGELMRAYAAVVVTGRPLAEDDVPFETRGEERWFSNRGVAVGRDGLSLTWRDTTEQVLARQDLASRAVTDPLTGLLNRAGLDEAARRLRGGDRRQARGAAVLYIDLDGLGDINRRHGHPAGDAVLAAVADRLAGVVRGGDVVARVGGDEFVVLAPGADDEGARTLALKLAQAVTRPVHVSEGPRLVPTISVGVTVGDADSDLQELVARADAAMLARKRDLYADTGRYAAPLGSGEDLRGPDVGEPLDDHAGTADRGSRGRDTRHSA